MKTKVWKKQQKNPPKNPSPTTALSDVADPNAKHLLNGGAIILPFNTAKILKWRPSAATLQLALSPVKVGIGGLVLT